MNKYYITFGQIHVHSVGGKTFDKDCLAEIEAESNKEAHQLAMRVFDCKFRNCHDEDKLSSVLEYYPRGIIKLK